MKKFKKMISALLTLVMLLSMIPSTAIAAETNPVLTVNTDAVTFGTEKGTKTNSSKELLWTVKATEAFAVGDKFYVPVTLSNMEKFSSFGVEFEYNKSVLQFLGAVGALQYYNEEYEEYQQFALTLTSAASLTQNPEENSKVTFAGTEVTNDSNKYGYLFFAQFEVIDKSITGKEEIGIKSCTDGLGISMSGVEYDAVTYVSGKIDIEKEEQSKEKVFINGTQKLTFEDAKAEAEGTWENTLISPGENYYFAGWFSDLIPSDIVAVENGYYVIEPTSNLNNIPGSELRPRYENVAEGVTYNALWIKDTAASTGTYQSFALTINDDTDTFDVYYGTAATSTTQVSDSAGSNKNYIDNIVLNNAIVSANGIARVKVIKDMELYQYLTLDVSFALDANGCTIKTVRSGGYYVFKMKSNSIAYTITIDSSRGEGTLSTVSKSVINYSDASVMKFKNIKLDTHDVIKLASGFIQECTIINSYTSAIFEVRQEGNIEITNSFLESEGGFVNLTVNKDATITILDCEMNSNSKSSLFSAKAGYGTITMKGKNTLEANNSTTMFTNWKEVKFDSIEGEYRLSATAADPFTNVSTVSIPEGKKYGVANGLLKFGTPYKVTYKGYDGSVLADIAPAEVVAGCNADLSLAVESYGTKYAHVGWATTQDGEKLESFIVEEDTTLYALRRERGAILNAGAPAEKEYMPGECIVVDNIIRSGQIIDNANMLSDYSELIYKGNFANLSVPLYGYNEDGKWIQVVNEQKIADTYIQVKFHADALDSIASNVTSQVVIIAEAYRNHNPIEVEHNGEMHSLGNAVDVGDALARVVLKAEENSNTISVDGTVDVWVQIKPEEGKSYLVYYIPDDGSDPVAMPTSIVDGEEIGQSGKTFAKFTTTHFSTFEVRESEVANGYTAAMTIVEDEVRAGGNMVTVNIDVTHMDLSTNKSDTTFNAAEIKVSYDPNLLTPVTDGMTNDTFKVENGVWTIETYGEPKDLGDNVFTLQFTTCSSVEKQTTATINLTSAAFADSVDAQSEDLIAATRAPGSDSVMITLEAFEVILPDDSLDLVEGKNEAVKGEDYTFTIQQDEQYDYDVNATVKRGEEYVNVTVTEDPTTPGKYIISGSDVNGPIEVTYTKTAHKYDVKFEGVEPAGNDGAEAAHDTDYTFTMPTKAQWQYSYEIAIGNEKFEHASVAGDVITIRGEYITGDIVITISGEQTEFNVSIEGDDATVKNENDTAVYEKNDNAVVTIAPAPGYTYVVTANSADGTREYEVEQSDENENIWTVKGIETDVIITISKNLVGTVTVSQYLTLDATNRETPSLSMFLVRYETEEELAEGFIPYCGDQAMFWSEKYKAYCCLEIGSTQAAVEEAITVKVAAGEKNEISYTMNVNGSANTDAADAQLVYDMYMAMYQDFDTIDMMTFLLADTSGTDAKITVDDAQAIISSILNLNNVTQ